MDVNETRGLESIATGRITDVENASLRMMAAELLEVRQVLPLLRRTFHRQWDEVLTVSGKPSSTQRVDAYLERVAAVDAAAAPVG